jgi:hypothetical protein
MNQKLPIPEPLWNTIPIDAQAALLAAWKAMGDRIAKLEATVRDRSRFVERMLTVVATCRQQGRNVLDYLTSCFEAARKGHAVPSLLPVPKPAIKTA